MSNKKEVFNKLLRLSGTTTQDCETQVTTKEVFLNQLLDSAIVGGIGGFSTWIAAGESAGLKVFGIAFFIAFLFKLKEYRKIK